MLNSAKQFALKNKERIAAGVEKATDTIDKKTHGKYHDKLEKVDGATAKFAAKPKDAAATATDDTAAAPAPEATAPGADDTKAAANDTKPAAETDAV
jgi:hypothetical protein